jgi:ATP-binding cassette subfamily F protein 3
MRITLNNIAHDYAGTVVLAGVTEKINSGERIGIVGANGCGKTTLVRILTGELTPVSGAVTADGQIQVGYVPQHMEADETIALGDYLLSDVLAQRSRLRRLEEEMAQVDPSDEAALARVLDVYQAEREQYDRRHGDHAEEGIERLIREMGLSVTLDQPLETLSGGERNVISLAHAVIERPDLLVLDEPGNHLDFAGLEWLESYLSGYDGMVCVVSHNRYLLDRVATRIWELCGGKVRSYSGGYSDYRFARLTQALSDQATYNAQQRTIQRLEELVRTFELRARVTGDPKWGKRLRARRTQLDKTRQAAMAQPDLGNGKIEVAFTESRVRSDIAVDVAGYNRSFDDLHLFSDASLTIHVGERVGIVGPNGAGKTTFLNDLVRTGAWENQTIRIGPSMTVGYCAQHRDRFPPETSVLDAMLSVGNFTRKEVNSVLGRLLFEWEDLDRPVGTLSGGEWNRLQLGIAIIAKASLLVLDEPTNHLDIPSREAVEEALAEFNGTILTVSHDRYFLDAVAERIEEIADRSFISYPVRFSEYWAARPRAGRPAARTGELAQRGRAVTGKPAPKRGAAGRPADQAATDRAAEAAIEQLEAEQRDLERKMAAAFDDGDYRGGRKLGRDLEKVRARIEELYEQWGAVP